ncbi:PREDICTED: integumentary mucin C.1-like [Acropora digitifera]|uniref:integumentary mucin C.1-like n=1 Tax=Acropora digitifera TaxID=70779 RepID=UPI00077AFA42|nr:PREDICTED: integumentary mucin C.1-like [Acropora digitifera]
MLARRLECLNNVVHALGNCTTQAPSTKEETSAATRGTTIAASTTEATSAATRGTTSAPSTTEATSAATRGTTSAPSTTEATSAATGGTTSAPSTTEPTSAETGGSAGPHWAIMGPVVGGIVVLGIVVGFVSWWVHKRRNYRGNITISNSDLELGQ